MLRDRLQVMFDTPVGRNDLYRGVLVVADHIENQQCFTQVGPMLDSRAQLAGVDADENE